jgi:hypothetical protein
MRLDASDFHQNRAGLYKNTTTMEGKSVYDTGVYKLHSTAQVTLTVTTSKHVCPNNTKNGTCIVLTAKICT